MFDGDEENYDCWGIQWKAFAQEKNLVVAIWKERDYDMPAFVSDYNKTEKDETDKEQKAAVKESIQAIEYL